MVLIIFTPPIRNDEYYRRRWVLSSMHRAVADDGGCRRGCVGIADGGWCHRWWLPSPTGGVVAGDGCRRRGWLLSPMVGSTADDGCYRQYNILSQLMDAAAKNLEYLR